MRATVLTGMLVMLCAAVAITGCVERGAHLTGMNGPVVWQVTDLRVVERAIAGTPRDLYAFALVLTETQGSGLAFTDLEYTVSQPVINPAGASQRSSVRWKLLPHGELREPFSTPSRETVE